MLESEQPIGSAYPAAPWYLSGQCWIGLFRADRAITLPGELRHVLGRRWVVVALIRYRDGTLRYDELIVGVAARLGPRVGLFVQFIWVDDAASIAGGRAIWGLPKEQATFAWDSDTAHIADDNGPIATMRLARHGHRLPPIWLPAVGIGRRDGRWAFLTARIWACLGPAALRIEHWSARFPYRLDARPFASVSASPFRATFPPPKLISE